MKQLNEQDIQYAVVNMGNGNEIIKLIVEEMNDPNSEDTKKGAYILRYIKITPTASGRVQNNPSSVTNTANAINTVSDLFSLVKQYDKNFKPNPASKIVNEDGTPKVVYVLVGIRKIGTAVLYDLKNIYEKEITDISLAMASDDYSQRSEDISVENSISQDDAPVNTQFTVHIIHREKKCHLCPEPILAN